MKECKIIIGREGPVIEADGRTVKFEGAEHADRFAGLFSDLGYDTEIIVKRKNETSH